MLNIYEKERVTECSWKANNFDSSANGRLSFDHLIEQKDNYN